jgi:hypothetical protein
MLFKQGSLVVEVNKVNVDGKEKYIYREFDGNDFVVYEHLISEETVKKFYNKIKEEE